MGYVHIWQYCTEHNNKCVNEKRIENQAQKENIRHWDQDAFRNDVMESTIGSSTVGFEQGWRISHLHWGVASGTPV